jgi:hypothetical protein
MPGLRHQVTGDSRLLFVECQNFPNRTSGVLPSLYRSPASAHQLGLHFGKIHSAAHRAGQQLGSQFLPSRLTVNDGKNGGRIEHNPIHLRLFTPGGRAAFREQFIDQRRALYVLPRAALRPLDAALLGRNAQFVVFDPQHDLISNLDAKGLTKRRRDYDTAILVHSGSGFFRHDKLNME